MSPEPRARSPESEGSAAADPESDSRLRVSGPGLLLLLVLALPTAAQQDPKQETVVECEWLTSWPEGEDTVMFLLAPTITRGDLKVRADHMILWVPKGGAATGFREFYAEGNINYRRGDAQLRAERLFYDAGSDRVFVLNLRGRGKDDRSGIQFQVQAERAREIAKGRFRVEGLSISTCEYGLPHFDVYMERGTLEGRQPRDPGNVHDLFPYDGWTFQGERISSRIWGVPLFHVPGFTVGSEQSGFPLRHLQVGESSRFGWYVLSRWGVRIPKGFIDKVTPWGNDDPGDDHERWGDISADVDWREIRGGAGGIRAKWQWAGYQGYLLSYYLHDRGRSDVEFDSKFEPVDGDDRGRVRLFHRHDLSPEWRYELELSYLSDKDLLEEFYPAEFKEDKEQETVAYLRWKQDHFAAFAMERHRLNQFQSQVEYMPRVEFQMFDQPALPGIWDRVLATTSAELVNQRFRFGSGIEGEDERSWRLDLLNELSLPIDLGFLQFAPYVSGRGTVWLTDLEDENETRWLFGGGGRIRTDLHGVGNFSIPAFGIHKVRHILQLETRFASNFHSSHEDTSDLFRYDEVDRLNRFDEVAFSIRNRFQTKLKTGDKWETWEFLDLGVQIEYYPNRARDTTVFNENNFAPPFHWITLAPETPGGGDFVERRWSNLHWDIRVNARNFFTLEGRGEYNLTSSREEAREFTLWTRPIPWLAVSVGQTFYREITDAYSLGVSWRPDEKWTLSAGGQYDNRTGEFTYQRAVVSCDFHEFILEGVFENDVGRDEQRFFVNFVPKLLGLTVSTYNPDPYRP